VRATAYNQQMLTPGQESNRFSQANHQNSHNSGFLGPAEVSKLVNLSALSCLWGVGGRKPGDRPLSRYHDRKESAELPVSSPAAERIVITFPSNL
jgi:hypothetical protein